MGVDDLPGVDGLPGVEVITGPQAAQTALQRPVLPLGADALDAVFPNRGLPCGQLTEFVGASGVGKTQWLLHIARAALRAEPSGTVVYFLGSGGDGAIRQRWKQLMACHGEAEMLGDRLSFRPVASLKALNQGVAEVRREKGSVVLVAVDGLSVVAGVDVGARVPQGHQELSRMGRGLKQLAWEWDIPVVVANGVVGVRDGDERDEKAALGEAWALLADLVVRVEMRTDADPRRVEKRYAMLMRSPDVMTFSPLRPFSIGDDGLR